VVILLFLSECFDLFIYWKSFYYAHLSIRFIC
jgi:hypothetical protein